MLLEKLEARLVPTSAYDLGGGVLFVTGASVCLVAADQGGQIRVFEPGREVPVFGLVPHVHDTSLVVVQAGHGLAVVGLDVAVPVAVDGRLADSCLALEAPGTVAVTLAAGVQAAPAAPVSVPLLQEGPNSVAVATLAVQTGVTPPAPRTLAQEAVDNFFLIPYYEAGYGLV